MVTARVGVVGAGWWSTRAHLPSLAGYDRAELVGVADLDHDRALQATEHFGGKPFASLNELIDASVDAVLIATTHGTHYQLARQALSAGLDVMVEKPMVIEPDLGFDLVDLAAREGRRLHVGYPYPHSQHALRARAAVANGDIGEVQLIASMFATLAGVLYSDADRFDSAEDALVGPDPATYRHIDTGGQARGQMTHSVSAMLFVTGVTPTEVIAYTSGTGLEVDMVDAGIFKTAEAAIGTVASTGAVPFANETMERLEVYGSAGHIQYGMSDGSLEVHASDGRHDSEGLEGLARYPEHMPARHLVDCFLDETPPLVDGILGAKTALFVDGLLRSAEAGTAQTVDFNERKRK
jgi:predicted dehydrogenase